jgi:hypothetical protein
VLDAIIGVDRMHPQGGIHAGREERTAESHGCPSRRSPSVAAPLLGDVARRGRILRPRSEGTEGDRSWAGNRGFKNGSRRALRQFEQLGECVFGEAPQCFVTRCGELIAVREQRASGRLSTSPQVQIGDDLTLPQM